MKRVFAILCAVLVMVCAVVPCFAESWSEVNTEYGNTWSAPLAYAQYEANTNAVTDLVDKAYALGLFGGAKPIAIVYDLLPNGDGFKIGVLTPSPNNMYGGYDTSIRTDKGTGAQVYVPSGSPSQLGLVIAPTVTRLPFQLWVLQQNGDWACSAMYSTANYMTISNVALGSNTSDVWKLVSAWNLRQEQKWNPCTFSGAYHTGSTAGGESAPQLEAVDSMYETQLALLEYVPPEPVPPTVSYQLDIPAIFDGMFNGVRSILSGFDINIFGISIVGMLVAFIVIAVVAFIVRKLWK